MALSDKKKGCRKENFMKKIVSGDRPTQAASFLKRNPTLKKKAQELQALCGISVVLVSFHPEDGRREIWPENESSVRDAVLSYKRLEQKLKVESNLFKFLEAKKAKLVKKKKQVMTRKLGGIFESLSRYLDWLSGQELMDFANFAQEKLEGIQKKVSCLELEEATHQAESVNPSSLSVPSVFNSLMEFNAGQRPTDNAEWNYNYSTTVAFGNSSNPENNTNTLTTENFNNLEAFNSDLMDEIWKQVLSNENHPGNENPENQIAGNGFLYGSGGSSIVEGGNVAMANEFNSKKEDFEMMEDYKFWWDGKMVQI